MSKEELQKLTCKELRDAAKKLSIKGRWEMTKEELIVSISEAENLKEENQTSAIVEEEVENSQGLDTETKENKPVDPIKLKYINDCEIGTLIAFMDGQKPRTAKLINRSRKRQLVKLVTQYGAEFVVAYKDIIWVRTSKTSRRWPKGVYNLLKGKNKDVQTR